MNFYPISLSFTTLSSLTLGIFVIYKDPKKNINLSWGISCLLCAGWSLCLAVSLFSSYSAATILIYMLNVLACLLAVVVASFCDEISEQRSNRWIFLIGYGLCAWFTILGPNHMLFYSAKPFLKFKYFTSAGPHYWIVTGHFIFYAFFGIYLLVKALKKNVSNKKNQIKYVLIGLTLGYFCGFSAFLSSYRVPVDPFFLHFVWIYAAIISYAILKHKLMDIKIVIKRTLFYSLFVIMLSMIYVGVIFIAHNFLIEKVPFPTKHLYPMSLSFTTLFSFILGLFVILKNPLRKLNLTWGIACLCVGCWAFCFTAIFFVTSQVWADFFGRQMNLYAAYIPVLIVHFCIEIAEYPKKWLFNIVYLGYLLCAIFTLFGSGPFFGVVRPIMGFRYYTQAGPLFAVFTAHFVFYSMLGIFILLKNYSRHSSERRNQIKYVLLGLSIGYLTGAIAFLPVYGIRVEPFLLHFVWLYAAIISYSILKHRLLDIKIVIKKTISYSAIAVLISAVYLSAVLIFYFLFIEKNTTSSYITSFIGVIFIALTFKPIEMFLHRVLERKFFKGTIGEISDQKAFLETELERRERLKSVGVLAAGMAHEIKNPITAIRTFADYLPKKYEDPDFREKFSKLLVQETDRISEIVRDLLLFARPSEPIIKSCSVNDILKGVTDLLRADLSKHSITLEQDQSRQTLCLADPPQLKQALLNIIMNAVDAMKLKVGERRLETKVSQEGNFVEILISDTGVGIAPEKIAHLFDPFYTDKEDGTGLGLAITHSIIEKNRGKIEVESVVGQGTTFKIFLPAGG